MSDWQDISTAPKDGTAVLLFDPGGDRGENQWIVAAWYEYRDGRGTWFGFYDGVSATETPTHWQPLPSPPVTAREKE